MSDSKPLQDQVNKVWTIVKEIVNGGVVLSESLQALLLMSKLPESYSTLVSAIMATTKVTELKMETIESWVLAEESVRCSDMEQSVFKTSQVKKKSKGPCQHCGGNYGLENCWVKYPHKWPDNKGKGKKKGKDKDKGKAKAIEAPKPNSSTGSSSSNPSLWSRQSTLWTKASWSHLVQAILPDLI